MQLKSSYNKQEDLSQLAKWFSAEWNSSEPFNNAIPPFIVPEPILAFDKSKLIAGLAFKMYPSPMDESNQTMGLWINAVLTHPDHRHQQIASKLIKQALIQAKDKYAIQTINTQPDQKNLYVYTHLPDLYLKLGWKQVKQQDNFYVLAHGFK